jgi:hypothetical protein
MFVRWRQRPSGRLSARLVHNERIEDRVRQRHVAELGAISVAALNASDLIEGIAARRAFWRAAAAACSRLSGRIQEATIREALADRVPLVTPGELRRLLLFRTQREVRFWKNIVALSQLAAEQAGRDTELQKHSPHYEIFQWGAEARLQILGRGEAIQEERELSAERMHKALADHGISATGLPRKPIEELTRSEFEALLERCGSKSDSDAR